MAVHPGDILKAELKERGIKQKDFAMQIGLQATHLNELLHGKRNISPEVAAAIEDVLGIPAVEWLNLQCMYDFDTQYLATKSIAEAQARLEISEYDRVISVPELLKRTNPEAKTYVERLEAVKEAVQMRDPQELTIAGEGMFRKSRKSGMDQRLIRTWVILAQRNAATLPVAKGHFDRNNTDSLVAELRSIFNENKDVVAMVTETFSEYGIKFGIEPKLDKTAVDGYSFLEGDVPCIIVTKRFDKIDLFAFSVMHELGHVIQDLNPDENAILSCSGHEKSSSKERSADEFASSSLIPRKIWSKVPSVKPNVRDMQQRLTLWASEIGYNKWLVLGRAAHDLNMCGLKEDGMRRIG